MERFIHYFLNMPRIIIELVDRDLISFLGALLFWVAIVVGFIMLILYFIQYYFKLNIY